MSAFLPAIDGTRLRAAFLWSWAGLVSLTFTGIASDVSWLVPLKLELVAVLLLTGGGAWLYVRGDLQPFRVPFVGHWFLCNMFLLAILVTQAVTSDRLGIVVTSEWRHLVKAWCLAPLVLAASPSRRERALLLRIVLWSVAALAAWTLVQWIRAGASGRLMVAGRHGDPNFLATYFGMALLLLIPGPAGSAAPRWVDRAAILLLAAGILVSQSRMGIATILVALLAFAALQLPWRRVLTLGGVGLTGLILFMWTTGFGERVADINDSSVLQRFQSIIAGANAFVERPWTGWGVNTSIDFLYKYSWYPDFQSLWPPISLHNTYMQVLSELGLLGFAAWGAVWFTTTARVCRRGVHPAIGLALVLALVNMSALPMAYDDAMALWTTILLLGAGFPAGDQCRPNSP